jgi:hypothetical protein
MSNRERYQRHVLIPNMKHAIVKLRQFLLDVCKPIVEGSHAPQISRIKPPKGSEGATDLQSAHRRLGRQEGAGALVQIETTAIRI